MRWPLAIALIALGGSVVTPAFDRELDRRAIELAQTQARAPDAAARQRLHAAYRLPVKTVAARSGYRSVSSFVRRFHERYGVEPSKVTNAN
jgi:AraC-like DNA-binding protein